MTNYETELAKWATLARKDPAKPIEAAIVSLNRAKKHLLEANLENRHDKLKETATAFDNAVLLFQPAIPKAVIRGLLPIQSGFDVALKAYNDAAHKRRGLLAQRDKISQEELDAFKRNAGGVLDKLIKWFESLPEA